MLVRPGLAVVVLLASGVAAPLSAQVPTSSSPPRDLTTMTLEELANLQVTVAARKPQIRSETPAAIDVVTSDDIRRAGVTSFPEALRLAPGVQVARANSNRWAVGIRGFTSTLSRSMLVLMDGRSVYTPLFAGVYWETQDTLLADVDRLEVVRGPGGTLWGANAVNGVVNLITKSAADTQGLYLEAGAGTEERGFGAVRYGGRFGESGAYRVYGKFFDRGPAFHPDGDDFDAWHMGQGGFRADWGGSAATNRFTLQGDAFGGRLGQRRPVAQFDPPYRTIVEADGRVSGGNILGRWNRRLGERSGFSAQVYYDRTNRTEAYFDESRNTVDVDLQHRFAWDRRNDVVWGLGYRITGDQTTGVPTPFFDPQDRTTQLFTGFVQDEISLFAERVRLSLGAKVEHNDYSGFEAQPSARLLWRVADGHRLWLAASRAVRTPSRADTDQAQTVYLGPTQPIFLRATGDKDFESETAVVYEAGYRTRLTRRLDLDLAAFHDRYDGLLGGRVGTPFVEAPPTPHLVIPILFGNLLEGETYGGELSADTRPLDRWRLSAAYAYLRVIVRPRAPTPGLTSDTSAGSSPRHQVQVQSSLDLPRRTSFDLYFRYVSELPAQRVPGYASLDARVAWRPVPRLEISVVGQNLLDPHHPEFGGGVEIERGVYGRASWGW
jgi:iron complex outermembrane receptor protein